VYVGKELADEMDYGMTALVSGSKTYRISVVIATLGGPTLKGTIETLNRGSVVPDEILVCLPPEEAARGLDFSFPNVRVVQTNCRGQVGQRIVGFRHAAGDFVLQLDDDMEVDHDCLKYLLIAAREFPDVAVAPALLNSLTNDSVYHVFHTGGLFRRAYHWLMNGKEGYQEGSIQRSGLPIGIVLDDAANRRSTVEWLAGGCVMHRRALLILDNYFPFAGKAYCEDIIHSHLLAEKGVRLLVEPRARCSLKVVPPFDWPPKAFLRNTYHDFLARRYFMLLSGRPLWRMYLHYALILFRYIYLAFARTMSRRARLSGVAGKDSKCHAD
jgi:glycosyltransferase involved in cell wall biosynthesis